MKTVMKKMFSLLLVAVMLIGVMPFQAFAAGHSLVLQVYVDGDHEAGPITVYADDENKMLLSDWQSTAINAVKSADLNVAFDHWAWGGGGDFNSDHVLTESGWTIVAHLNSVCTQTAGCRASSHNDCLSQCNRTVGCPNSTNHHSDCDKLKCNVDGCEFSKDHGGKHDWQCTKTAGCELRNGHTDPALCTDQKYCENCNDVIIANDPDHVCCTTCHKSGHLYTACPDVIRPCCKVAATEPHAATCYTRCTGLRDCKNVNHDPAKNCEWEKCDIAGCTKLETESHTVHPGAACLTAGCTLDRGHTGDHSNVCATCGKPKMKSPEHNTNCPYYYLNAEPSNTGDALVRVHVRLHNGTTLVDTVELLTYRDDKGTQIGDSVSAHKSLIVAELAEEYPEYSWSGNLYDDPGESQDYNELIGTGTTVYINAYAGQDMVLVYVHNSRSHSSLRIIQLEGKRRGDTVTKKEVTSAVSKYFNVSSLSMYSEDAWEDYVAGENVESVSSLKIPSDDAYYVIDVKISGTAKSGSGSGYTADSSNPKTGDTIFAPVAVMGLSVSALAVLLYLNKKRAF